MRLSRDEIETLIFALQESRCEYDSYPTNKDSEEFVRKANKLLTRLILEKNHD